MITKSLAKIFQLFESIYLLQIRVFTGSIFAKSCVILLVNSANFYMELSTELLCTKKISDRSKRNSAQIFKLPACLY